MDGHTDERPAYRRVTDTSEKVDCFAVEGRPFEPVPHLSDRTDGCEPNEIHQIPAPVVDDEEGNDQESEYCLQKHDFGVRPGEGKL